MKYYLNRGISPNYAATRRFPLWIVCSTLLLFSSGCAEEESEPVASSELAAEVPGNERAVEEEIEMLTPFLEQLEDYFRAQARDAEWATSAEGLLRNAFLDAGPTYSGVIDATTLTSLECRTNACRASFIHSSRSAFRQMMGSLDALVPWDHMSHFLPVSTNPFTSVVFMSREGHLLPQE